MQTSKTAPAEAQARDVRAFAKKYRIEIEDAEAILKQYGSDQKAADKAARRIAL